MQRQHPLAAALLLSAMIFSARAGEVVKAADEQSLLGTEWVLVDLAGTGVSEQGEATLGFPQPGTLAGDASCNRYRAVIEFDDDGHARLSALVSTRRFCSPDTNAQETRFLEALQGVLRLEREAGGLLLHASGFDAPLRFAPRP
jgi:heat shock protein HslJ